MLLPGAEALYLASSVAVMTALAPVSHSAQDVRLTGVSLGPTAAAAARGPRPAPQRFFAQHTAEVVALALHPSGEMVATAQGPDRNGLVLVWGVKQLKVLVGPCLTSF